MPNQSGGSLVIVGVLSLAAILMTGTVIWADETPAPAQPVLADRFPAFQEVLRDSSMELASLPAQGDSLTLFKNVIGPRLGLNDAAMTIGAKGLTPALTKELLLDDLNQSARNLVRGLAVWQLAKAVRDLGFTPSAEQEAGLKRQIDDQLAWLTEGTTLEPPLRQLLELLQKDGAQGVVHDSPAQSLHTSDAMARRAEAAAQIEIVAIQTVHSEWFRLLSWKDQVRQQRGLVRLCGTWQWSIHNHQNHREDKTTVVFASSGGTATTSPAEIIVLGDSVYLRWETSAGVQEDSLLFSGEGQRLEGTFVNTAGGWGSITGKRTASCFPKTGDKPAAGQRRHR